MRVAIDAAPLLVRSAGVKNYLYHWILHLRRAAGAENVLTVPAMRNLGGLDHEHSVAGFWRTWSGLAALAAVNFADIPLLDWFGPAVDVFHTSNLLRHPPRKTTLTATIHDMTCWLMPELHAAANVRADKEFAHRLRRANRLIAVSASTRDDAVRLLGLDAGKIEVIHSGVAEEFFEVSPDAAAAARAKYALDRPFVLFLGTVEPRKNLDLLLDAFAALPASLREEFELVVAGPLGWAPAATVARLKAGGGVRYLGYVPESAVAPLTAAATVFAYPSLYEGFGFPVAQAMAAGVPVVTSAVSSLPEIVGDAALTVDPHSASELRDALSRLLLSPALRGELAASGVARANLFRWEACAEKSLRFFERAAGS